MVLEFDKKLQNIKRFLENNVLEFDKKLQNIKRFLENNKINLLGGENEESIF